MPASTREPSLVCAETELRTGQPIRKVIDGQAILIVRDDTGVIRAVDDTCTHAQISLADGFIEGRTVECWAHGARFDLATGQALTLPADPPLTTRRIEVHDGMIYVT